MFQSVAKTRAAWFPDSRAAVLIAGLWVLWIGLAASLVVGSVGSSFDPVLAIAVVTAAVVSERFSVPLTQRLELTALTQIVLVLIMANQVWTAIMVAIAAEVSAAIGLENWRERLLIWIPARPSEAAIGIWVFALTLSHVPNRQLAITVAAVAMIGINMLTIASVFAMRDKPARQPLVDGLRAELAALLALPLVWGAVRLYEQFGVTAVVAALGPVILLQYLYRLFQERAQAIDAVNESSLSFAIGLVRALDAADPSTAGHSAQVAVYARDVAREMGHDEEYASAMQLAALLHDIGKVGVQTQILRKEDKLDEEEWNEVKLHPATGESIVRELPSFDRIGTVIRHHHERPDGSGYPDSLSAGEIPLGSLIIGVVDAYSAMVQNRFYSAGRAPQQAIAELEKNAGQQFDAGVVGAFVHILAREGEPYQRGETDEFRMDVQRAQVLEQLGRIDRLHRAICRL